MQWLTFNHSHLAVSWHGTVQLTMTFSHFTLILPPYHQWALEISSVYLQKSVYMWFPFCRWSFFNDQVGLTTTTQNIYENIRLSGIWEWSKTFRQKNLTDESDSSPRVRVKTYRWAHQVSTWTVASTIMTDDQKLALANEHSSTNILGSDKLLLWI